MRHVGFEVVRCGLTKAEMSRRRVVPSLTVGHLRKPELLHAKPHLHQALTLGPPKWSTLPENSRANG
jgi:hypothetical protein